MITRSTDHLQVAGDVTMATVAALFSEGLISPENQRLGNELVVDFAHLNKVDSSAVSLMLAWMREAKRSNVKLRFINVPHNLMSLAKLYGVAELLTLSTAE